LLCLYKTYLRLSRVVNTQAVRTFHPVELAQTISVDSLWAEAGDETVPFGVNKCDEQHAPMRGNAGGILCPERGDYWEPDWA
jgi:hypothetical protein